MFEPQTRNGVGEFDINKDVVAIQFQDVVFAVTIILFDVHGEGCNLAIYF